jgi:hypothetical protein
MGWSTPGSWGSHGGWSRAAVTTSPVVISFTDSANDSSGTNPLTFTAKSLGTSDPTRRIIIGIAGRSGSVINPITSVTVDGISASQVATSGSVSNTNVSALWMADLSSDSNTTGNIVVTFPNAPARFGIAVWRMVNPNTGSVVTATDTQASSTTSSATLTIPAGGAAVGIGFIQDGETTSSIAGLTGDVDAILAASNGYVGAHANSMTGGSTTLTFTWAGTFATNGAFAAWGS